MDATITYTTQLRSAEEAVFAFVLVSWDDSCPTSASSMCLDLLTIFIRASLECVPTALAWRWSSFARANTASGGSFQCRGHAPLPPPSVAPPACTPLGFGTPATSPPESTLPTKLVPCTCGLPENSIEGSPLEAAPQLAPRPVSVTPCDPDSALLSILGSTSSLQS